MSKNILLIVALFVTNLVAAQSPPKRELRGGWIATFVNIDWPKSRSLTAAQQQAALDNLLNLYQSTRLNAVYLQVRSQCDALYASSIEPWTADLTGTQGNSPGYDPLAYAIEQAHSRSLELHAWFNPYRALSSATTTNLNNLAASHVINQHPEWIMPVTTNSNNAQQRLLNPGLPAVRDYVIKVVMDVVRRYDVDGIHFDDYFYTNPATTTYNDDAAFAAHNPHGLTKADWRRANVDSLIKRLGDSIRTEKPWVKFGVSPSGIWMSQANDALGSNTSAGALQHKKDLFANSRLWQQEGWVDYLMPQVYWWMGQTGSDYSILAPWWNNNAFSRHMYIGQAGYKVGDANQGQFNTNPSQINNQVRLNRSLANIQGQVVYNTTSLVNNLLKFTDSLRTYMYTRPALQHTMPWKDATPPPAPHNLQGALAPNTLTLNWQAPPTGPSDPERAWQYAVYRSETSPVNISSSDNLLAVVAPGQTSFADQGFDPAKTYFYVVTSLDRLHNESEPTGELVMSNGVLPLRLLTISATMNAQRQADIRWHTTDEEDLVGYELEKSTNGARFDRIAMVPAKNQPGLQQYQYTDALAAGTTWYRLRMLEKSGRHSYSKLVALQVNAAGNIARVYPTMVSAGQAITVALADANQPVRYRVSSTNGVVLTQGVWQGSNTVQSLVLPSNAAAGIYFLQLDQGTQTASVKLVVQ